GSDYIATNGVLTFLASDHTPPAQTITVTVIDDTIQEPDEVFYLQFSDAQGAVTVQDVAVATILNDDVPVTMAISGASVLEGNQGTTNAVFTVTVDGANGQQVSVDY